MFPKVRWWGADINGMFGRIRLIAWSSLELNVESVRLEALITADCQRFNRARQRTTRRPLHDSRAASLFYLVRVLLIAPKDVLYGSDGPEEAMLFVVGPSCEEQGIRRT